MKITLKYCFIILLTANLSSCELWVDMVSNDDTKTIEHNIKQPLLKIILCNDMDLELLEGEEKKIEINGAKDLIDKIEFDYVSNTLKISCKSLKTWMYDKPKIKLQMPQICNIQLLANNDVFANDTLRTENINIESEGTGDINLSINTKAIHIKAAYTCNFYLSGQTENLKIETYYGSIFYGENLKAMHIQSTCAGSNHQYIYPIKSLNCNIKHSGNVYYMHQPEDLLINSETGSKGKAIYTPNK